MAWDTVLKHSIPTKAFPEESEKPLVLIHEGLSLYPAWKERSSGYYSGQGYRKRAAPPREILWESAALL